MGNTCLSQKMMKKSGFVQAHLMRIAHYIMHGEAVWFDITEDGGRTFFMAKMSQTSTSKGKISAYFLTLT